MAREIAILRHMTEHNSPYPSDLQVAAQDSLDLPLQAATPCLADNRADISPAAKTVLKGTKRLLGSLGYGAIEEFPLKNNRRADLLAISKKADLSIVEVKSGIADFRADTKWTDYLDFCDRFFFAVSPDFPIDYIKNHPAYSERVGIILADQHGGEIIVPSIALPLHTSRRKTIVQRLAFIAGRRAIGDAFVNL